MKVGRSAAASRKAFASSRVNGFASVSSTLGGSTSVAGVEQGAVHARVLGLQLVDPVLSDAGEMGLRPLGDGRCASRFGSAALVALPFQLLGLALDAEYPEYADERTMVQVLGKGADRAGCSSPRPLSGGAGNLYESRYFPFGELART